MKKGSLKFISDNLMYILLAVIIAIFLFVLIYTRGKMFLP